MEKIVFQNPKIKDKITLLKQPHETNHEFILLEVELQPKGGNGLHYHTSFTEEFTPVAGQLGIGLGKKKLLLEQGQTATAPIGQPHYFYNPSKETIRFNVKITPAHEGFLNALRIAYGLAGDGLTNKAGVPKKIDHLALLIDLSDTRLTGIQGFISNLLLRRAKKVKQKQVYKQLLDKYC